jgi:hypothetical protein
MKLLYTLLSFFVLHVTAQAQVFAPVGAEWYLDANKSIFHAKVTENTVVNGQSCRKIVYTPHTLPPWDGYGFKLNTPTPRYVYNTDDTVFIYNAIFGKFTPLYVFNVQDGDTVTLPLLLPNDGCAWFMGSLGDSSFSFVVDSVRTVLYDTSHLQTVYTHSLSIPGKQKMSYPAYTRVMGNLEQGILPECDSCAYSLSEHCVGPYGVRCYKDGQYAIQLVSDDCSKGIKVSVQEMAEKTETKIYPNPFHEYFNIETVNSVSVLVYNSTGTAVMQHDRIQGKTNIDASHLPAGLYLVLVKDEQGQVLKAGKLLKN